MNFNRCLVITIGIIFYQSAYAESFLDTFDGAPKLNINLYVFAADVDGVIKKGNIQYDVDQPFNETIKELDHSFMAHADLNKGKWGVFSDKQLVKTSQEKNTMNISIALTTELDQSSYGVYYQAYVSPFYTTLNQRKLIIEPTIGIHRTKAEVTVSVLNKKAEIGTSWNEPFWGSRFKYNFDTPWNLSSEVTFGIENTISAHAYLGYRIPVLNRNINFRAGYRYFEQDYKVDNFHWNTQQHGPVVGFNLPIF